MIYLILYAAGYAFALRIIFPSLLESIYDPDNVDIFFAAVASFLVCIVWPLIGIGYLIYKVWLKPARDVFNGK